MIYHSVQLWEVRMWVRSSIFLLVLAVAGCKDPAPTKPAAKPSATASAPTLESCGTKSESLKKWLDEANGEGMGPPAPFKQMGMKLVAREDGDPWAWFGAALLFDKGAVQLDFEKLGAPSEADTAKKLEEALRQRAQVALAAGISMGLDVYVHADTPWETVVAMLEPAGKAGFRTVGLVFEGPAKVKAPESPLLAQLEKADEDRRSADDAFDEPAPEGPAFKALAQCRPAISVLREVGKGELTPKEKNAFFAKRAPSAWQSCRCRGDADALKAIQWHWLGRTYGPPTRSVKVLLTGADDTEATKVSAAKSDPWSNVAAKIVEAAKSGKRVALATE